MTKSKCQTRESNCQIDIRQRSGVTKLLQLEIVAGKYATVAVPKVHSSALAVAPHLAVAALARLHPTAVTVQFETVLPDIPEIIPMNVSLMIVAAYAKTARYGAVIED